MREYIPHALHHSTNLQADEGIYPSCTAPQHKPTSRWGNISLMHCITVQTYKQMREFISHALHHSTILQVDEGIYLSCTAPQYKLMSRWGNISLMHCTTVQTYEQMREYISHALRHSTNLSAKHRLWTGHCGLCAHLEQIRITDSTHCECNEAEHTVHRILHGCSLWGQQQHQSWLQEETTTYKLWGTTEDLRLTIQFLAACGLSKADQPWKRSAKSFLKHTLLSSVHAIFWIECVCV